MAVRFYIEGVKETLCERPFFTLHFNAIGNLLYTLLLAWKFLSLIILLFCSENIILGDDDREGFFHSFVALSAHYIGLNVTQCKYDENVSFHLIHYRW